MKRSLGLCVLLLMTAACSSGDSVSGTIQGNAFSVQDGLMFAVSETDGGVSGNALAVILVNIGNACSTLTADAVSGKTPPNIDDVFIDIADSSPITAKTYDISATFGALPFAFASVSKTNGTCNTVLDGGAVAATGGSITVSSVSASSASGSFSLDFGTDTLTGSFNVNSCAEPDAGTGSTTCG